MTSNQVMYHLGNRGIERRLLPYCIEKGIAVVGYAPFGHGDFPSPQSPKGRILEEIAKRHNCTARQIALNFLTRHDYIFTIPKTTRPERVKENSEGVGWKLTEDDVMTIENAFPAPTHDTSLGII